MVGVDVSHLLGCLNSNYLSLEIGSQYTNQLPKIEEHRIYKMMNQKDCSCKIRKFKNNVNLENDVRNCQTYIFRTFYSFPISNAYEETLEILCSSINPQVYRPMLICTLTQLAFNLLTLWNELWCYGNREYNRFFIVFEVAYLDLCDQINISSCMWLLPKKGGYYSLIITVHVK